MTLAANFMLFQAAWFTSVIGAANDRAWAGLVAIAAAATWHLARAARPARELSLLTIAALIGIVFETVLVQTGLTRYGSSPIPGLAPLWMMAMWILFATTLNVSLRALRQRTWLAVLLGAAGGPLAYYGGERLGAIQFGSRGLALLVIAAGWALLTPLLLRLAARCDGYAQS